MENLPDRYCAHDPCDQQGTKELKYKLDIPGTKQVATIKVYLCRKHQLEVWALLKNKGIDVLTK